ncbi:MAG: hypothetical protein A2075_10025 [Geobacteraceae bacterium GWC2_58_44]|nr:MAG: hypothetical protein A2075_10025 [Geobacteraceae bacterium GWC2_58_44]
MKRSPWKVDPLKARLLACGRKSPFEKGGFRGIWVFAASCKRQIPPDPPFSKGGGRYWTFFKGGRKILDLFQRGEEET